MSRHEVDLLLVTPSSRNQVYQGLSTNLAALEPPVWSGLIATFIRQRHYSVAMLDAEARGLSHDQTAQEIVKINPKLLVYMVYGQQPSASTQCMPGARELAIKVSGLSDEIKSLIIGTHSSALPERTLREEAFDYVCQGEGPYTVLGLLEVLRGERPDLSQVPGLWYKQDGVIKHNLAAPKMTDLHRELPEQALDLLDMSLYRAHNWHAFDNIDQRQPYASLQTSLGCPYRCSFCCINAPFGGPGIRYWDPENIISQIDVMVKKYGVRHIKIPDEMFVFNEKHVAGICDKIIERGYDLNIWAYARVDTVRPKLLEKLKKAGFNWLALGIESGSQHVRDGVEKGRFKDDSISKIVSTIRDSGINVLGNYIFGLPDDTRESMQQTLDLAMELNTEWANFYCAMAYPGSPLYDMAIKNGWRLPDSWIGFSQHAYETLPLPTETLSGSEVLAFRDKAFLTYFKSPRYIDMIEKKFGRKASAHVNEMTAWTLKRKFVEEA